MAFASGRAVGIVLAVAAILFLYWFFGTEIGSAMRATGNNEDMVRALGVDTRMAKLLSLMVSNGLVALSGALVCQSQKYGKAVTCVCFMGGDVYPLEVERLAQFLCCRQSIAPVKVGWYSGKSELPADFNMSYFEYIKLGPYVEALGGLKSAKTNQRLYRIVNGKMEDITYRFLSNQLFV